MLPLKLTSWYEPLSSTLNTSSVEMKLFYVLQNGMKAFDLANDSQLIFDENDEVALHASTSDGKLDRN
jgi:hypothetical protein